MSLSSAPRALRALIVVLALASGARAADAPTPAGEEARTRAAFDRLCTELNEPCNACGKHHAPGDTPAPKPTPRAADDPLRHPIDAWGRSVQISVGGEGVMLRSAGADGQLGTADDLTQSCGEAAK